MNLQSPGTPSHSSLNPEDIDFRRHWEQVWGLYHTVTEALLWAGYCQKAGWGTEIAYNENKEMEAKPVVMDEAGSTQASWVDAPGYLCVEDKFLFHLGSALHSDGSCLCLGQSECGVAWAGGPICGWSPAETQRLAWEGTHQGLSCRVPHTCSVFIFPGKFCSFSVSLGWLEGATQTLRII